MFGDKKEKAFELHAQLAGAYSEYQRLKDQLIKDSITRIESRRSKLVSLTFASLVVFSWLVVIFADLKIDNDAGVEVIEIGISVFSTSVIVFFFISYFTFFHISKMAIKPSIEEIEDDTSYLAVFSACESRERRGLVSAIFGVLHTIVLGFCLLLNLTGSSIWSVF